MPFWVHFGFIWVHGIKNGGDRKSDGHNVQVKNQDGVVVNFPQGRTVSPNLDERTRADDATAKAFGIGKDTMRKEMSRVEHKDLQKSERWEF